MMKCDNAEYSWLQLNKARKLEREISAKRLTVLAGNFKPRNWIINDNTD